MPVSLVLTPNRLATILSLIVISLLLANLLCILLQHSGHTFHTMSIFYFNREGNLPSLYSAMAIFLSAFLFWTNGNIGIARKRKERVYWRVFAVVFIFLGIDELISIHETLTDNSQQLLGDFTAGGYFHFAWIIPYCAMLVILLAFTTRFLWRLPAGTRSRFFFAGIVFITGAVGMEALGGNYVFDRGDGSKEDVLYAMLVTCEELLEMAGVILLIQALFAYRVGNTKNRVINLNISCRPNEEPRAHVRTRVQPEKNNGAPGPLKNTDVAANAGTLASKK